MYKINRLRDYGLVVLAFLMQIFLADFLSIGFVKPNFIIVIVVFFALFTDENFGMEVGAVCGIILDIFGIRLFGFNAILFGLTGYMVGRFNDKIYRESIITHAIIVFAASFFILSSYRVFLGLQNRHLLSALNPGFVFSPSVFIAALYNVFIGSFAYTFLCRILRLGETTVL